MRFLLIIFILSLFQNEVFAQQLNEEEKKLYSLLMDYRKEKGLPIIPLSQSLTFVAQTHAKDLNDTHPDVFPCNMLSWSSKGPGILCCYTSDHAKAECMWSKPKELTSYTGNGFEISYGSFGSMATALGAIGGWKKSARHNAVIINQGVWKEPWNAIGLGIYQGYAVVWFGNEKDK